MLDFCKYLFIDCRNRDLFAQTTDVISQIKTNPHWIFLCLYFLLESTYCALIVFDAFRYFVFIYDCSSLGAGAGIHDWVLPWCCALTYFSPWWNPIGAIPFCFLCCVFFVFSQETRKLNHFIVKASWFETLLWSYFFIFEYYHVFSLVYYNVL